MDYPQQEAAWGVERRREMARMMIVAIALVLPLLAGCAGMYVAGDVGPHSDSVNAPRPADDTSR
jgi:hypothetical protein